MIAGPALDELVVTDSVAPRRLDPGWVRRKLTILPVAPLVAEAVRRIHQGGSIAERPE